VRIGGQAEVLVYTGHHPVMNGLAGVAVSAVSTSFSRRRIVALAAANGVTGSHRNTRQLSQREPDSPLNEAPSVGVGCPLLAANAGIRLADTRLDVS
jgi:hypothetical protein